MTSMKNLRSRLFVLTSASTLLLVASACQVKGGGGATSANSADGDRPAGGNLIKNADFESGAALPWNSSFTPPANGELAVKDGAACTTIHDGGANNWDAQIRHREFVIQEGHTYNIAFKIWADKPTMVRPKVGQSGPPYQEMWQQTVNVTTTPQLVRGGFVHRAPDDPAVEFAFHMGGNMLRDVQLPITICIDDIYLSDPQFEGASQGAEALKPNIRINQLGYFPNAKKIATVVNETPTALPFKLSRGGQVVLEGQTEPFGLDTDSGDHVHLVDFTKVKQQGEGYILQVGDDQSAPFEIANDLYAELKYDALRYFYHNRSGIEIKMPYAKGEQWTRPAGHAQSDKSVPCGADVDCKYSLDVTGGWYDAGDHGKYVVNGGISVWTMMNQYERFKERGSIAPFADGKMNIPESGNGVPDILDEARWQMEFMLKMQVPAGKPKAGMVHHKMHDTAWSALGIAPHDAEKAMKRNLRPVSTAATLNLAATGAQCARIFKAFDPAFAAKCKKAAETAWVAAKQYPNIQADPNDNQKGGGPYDDKDVSDEFFWAAAELYILTKNPQYKQEMQNSQYWNQMTMVDGGVPTAMTWGKTDALGTISLALVPGALSGGEMKARQQQIVAAADKYVELIQTQGYRMPFNAGSSGKYPWGSNSFIINNMMILGYAYDFSGQDKYLEGMVLGMDYLLGRNGMAQSYVTGYGHNPLKNPHHRFWSKQYDPKFPAAPPGAVSGGPNSSLQDPYVKAAGLEGCQPQKCFMDHIEAWSVNEITINWNAPFAWVTAYLDENAGRAKAR